MLAFVHLPKTAGTTLHKIIAHQHEPGQVWIHHDTDGSLSAATAAEIRRRKVEVIMGHLSVGIHRELPEVRYLTCMRDPMARLVSHYRHALNDPAHYLHDAVTRDRLDLAGYIASGLSGELSNGMTRMLAGVDDFHGARVDDDVLALAKQHLEEHFDAVVFSEKFDEGCLSLAMRYGWDDPFYLRRKVGNHVPIPGAPVREQWARVASYNRYDQELYDWAWKRFNVNKAQVPTQLRMQFERSNEGIGKLWFCLREVRLRMTRLIRAEHEGTTAGFHQAGAHA